MSIEGDIAQDVVVDQGVPAEESKATNPILDPQPTDEPTSEPAAEEKKADDEQPIPKGVQKRIDRAVRQKYEAEARAKMLEERLTQLESRQFQPQQPQQPTDEKEPTLDQFDSFDEYLAAKAEWIAERKINQTLTERERALREQQEVAYRRKVEAEWTKRITQATDEIPDFEDVVGAADVPMTDVMRETIMESDIGPKVAYFLATNPEEAYKIAGMSPIAAVRALGRIEERIVGGGISTKKTTSAPPPVKPVGAKASVKKDPGQMSDEEYAKWRKTGKA